ncbi:MAG: hypothetical protein QM681_14095 [Novosphingobium sp.]
MTLTQERKPTASPWEDPALLSYSIDTRGKDSINVQLNTALAWDVARLPASEGFYRQIEAGPYLVFNRNTQEKARQNNIEAGIKATISTTRIIPPKVDRPLPQANPPKWDAAFGLDLGYARTATYADLEKAVCVATPEARQCDTQYKESIRSVAGAIFNVPFESGGSGIGSSLLRYEFSPGIDLAYDHLLDNKINAKTGVVETGGYLSAAPSAKFGLFVGSDSKIKLEFAGQVRVRLHASATRSAAIGRSAGLGTASATYFFTQPAPGSSGWRAGVSVSFTRGSDPLTEKPDQSIILLAFKIGRF